MTNNKYDAAILEVSSIGQKRRTTYQYEALVRQLNVSGSWKSVNAKVLVSIADQSVDLPTPGDFVLLSNRAIMRPKPASNPNQLDYALYLKRRGIAWTIYLPSESYRILSSQSSVEWATWPARISQNADSLLREYLSGSEAYGLVKAMLLGRRDDLGPELQQSYASAGAIHVLAVSGLHVGVLFVLLTFILGWLKKWPWGSGLYMGAIILLLGCYALITGLSPSVLRASLMCIALAASQAISRKHHSINALSLSAFVILLLDPLSLFSVGFQLSYTAVAGILLLYPLGKNLVRSSFRPINWLWQITLIGLAAQLFTFPLSIYYFHQFPTYFWLINPLVISLTGGLIYSAIGTLLLGSIPFIGSLFAFCTDGIGRSMNHIVSWPAKLPGFLMENLYFSAVEVLVLFVWILVLYLTLKHRSFGHIKWLAAISLTYMSISLAQMLNHYTSNRIVVHAISRHTALSITQGQSAYILADPELNADDGAFDYNIKNYLNASETMNVTVVPLPDRNANSGIRLLTRRATVLFDSRVNDAAIGLTIVRSKRYPKLLSSDYRPSGTFLLSSELGFKTKEKWKTLLKSTNTRVVDLSESGSYEF